MPLLPRFFLLVIFFVWCIQIPTFWIYTRTYLFEWQKWTVSLLERIPWWVLFTRENCKKLKKKKWKDKRQEDVGEETPLQCGAEEGTSIGREISKWLYLRVTSEVPLRVGNKGANITNPRDEESNCLDKEVHEVVVFPKGNVVAATEKEVSTGGKLQQVKPVDIRTIIRHLNQIS